MPILIALVMLVAIIGGVAYAGFARFLAHRERLAELEAQRPRVTLALPPGELRDTDQLTDEILAACRERGVDVELELR